MSGGDFITKYLKSFCFFIEHGIENTFQYIELVECVNQTAIVMAKCMLDV